MFNGHYYIRLQDEKPLSQNEEAHNVGHGHGSTKGKVFDPSYRYTREQKGHYYKGFSVGRRDHDVAADVAREKEFAPFEPYEDDFQPRYK